MVRIAVFDVRQWERRAGEPTRKFVAFTCDVGPVRLAGCSLNMQPSGRVDVRWPRPRGTDGYVNVRDPEIRSQIVALALKAYRDAGGVLPADEP